MTERRRTNGSKSSKASPARRPSVRDAGTHLSLYNSGLEVWLYDDANADAIRDSGALDFLALSGRQPTETLESLIGRGMVVGYSLQQDDELEIAVYVGNPLTEAELAVSRWLEPQRAFLHLPSGTLCVEPNDGLRVGGETPTAKGGVVTVPPGDYRVTLYRTDYEALFREALKWKGPQEVIVLTPGGTEADAASDLLPFQARRDMTWVGRYTVQGQRAEALAWFNDYWDSCIVNLDAAAIAKLSLVPGSYLRIHAPATGVTLISAFGPSWMDAARMPVPTGVPLDEYGYAALSPMGEWNDAEALCCRREKATTRIEAEHHGVWIPTTVEVLDPAVHPPEAPRPKHGGFTSTELRTKSYYPSDFLSLILSDVLPGVGDLDELPLPEALDMLDAALAKHGFAPQGDLEWEEQSLLGPTERASRLYTGDPESFTTVFASDSSIDVLLVSELDDGRWIITGMADDFNSRLLFARNRGVGNEHIEIEVVDEALKSIVAAHRKNVRASKARLVPAPTNIDEGAAALRRLLVAAFG